MSRIPTLALITGMSLGLAATAALPRAAAAEALRLDIVAPVAPKAIVAPKALRVAEPKLKLNAVVEGDRILLGDLVEDAGEAAEAEVAPAPAPGQRLALDAGEVVAFAAAHGLAINQSVVGRKVMVSRAGRTVSRELIVSRLAEAMIERGIPADKARQIELASQHLSLKVPVDSEAAILVQDVDYDSATGRFTAIVTTPGESAAVEHVEISGRLIDTTRIPVPRGNLAAGQIIRADDVEWIDVPSDRLAGNVAAGAEQIIGQSARRNLRAGAPVITADLAQPKIVAKGALVTMTVITPNLTLSAIGRAQEPGALGDAIRLVNPSSSKVIQGIVTGPNEARIDFGPQLVSADGNRAAGSTAQ